MFGEETKRDEVELMLKMSSKRCANKVVSFVYERCSYTNHRLATFSSVSAGGLASFVAAAAFIGPVKPERTRKQM